MSLQGVLLYEGGARFDRPASTNPSSSRGSELHPANFTLHTNFPPQAYDEYRQSPSPIIRGARKTATTDLPPPPLLQPLYIIGAAFVGAGLGTLFYKLHVGSEWLKVLSLPGDLYIRALRCLIVPMVFCVLTIVVAENVSLGRTSIFRFRTLIPFLLSSTMAAVQGTLIAFLFQQNFTTTLRTISGSVNVESFNLTLQCANGLYLTSKNDTLACVGANATTFAALSQTNALTVGSAMDQLSLMDQVTGIADLMVTANIFSSFVDGSLLSIVFFSFPLGYVIAHATSYDGENLILTLLRQLRNIFLMLLYGLLSITYIAVCFLILSAIANFDTQHIGTAVAQTGFLFGVFLIGVMTHTILVMPLIMYLMTKANPFHFISHLFPAFVFSFGCASSMATLPVAIACLQRGNVSRALAMTSMPFGTPANMNGCALYYPMAVVFMAAMDGLTHKLTITRWLVIFLVGWLGSMGTAPVPNAGMVDILTLWKTCFPSDPLPSSFGFLFAADFIVDRIATTVNVYGNAMVTRILSDQVDETFEIQAAQRV